MASNETTPSQQQTQSQPEPQRARSSIFTPRRAIITGATLLILLAGIVAFRGIGRWLVREDPLAHADAIVVLSGGMPYRAEGAADLYRQGYAPEVWLTRPENPSPALAAMGIHFVGEEVYSREVLMHQGVPASAIRILPAEIIDTEQEIDEVSRQMRDDHASSVIIVTSPEHTRRVRALWVRLAAANQKAIVRAAAEDPFDRNHWWRNTRDAYAVVRELFGLANTWAGLPVRPHAAAH
jgi:uncharacterized SAM-binding protein YcdF (DUF218 family)